MYCLEVQRARLLEEIMSIKNLFQQESESVTEQPVKIPFDFTNRDSIPKGKDPGDCIVIKPITVRTWFRIRPLLLEIEKEDIDKMIVKSVKYLYLERMSETKNEIYGKQIRCLN